MGLTEPTAVGGMERLIGARRWMIVVSGALLLLVGCFVLGSVNARASSSAAGSWMQVAEPQLGHGSMESIACPSLSDCWAVGQRRVGARDSNVMIIHWDGSSWRDTRSPAVRVGSSLQSVTCPSASDCWAVGSLDGRFNGTLIEHWNGHAWSRVPSPTPYVSGVTGDQLSGVSCESKASCWATGGTIFFGASGYHVIILHWTGRAWVNVPFSDHPLAILYGVSCAGPGNCWAVGNGIARLKGSRWTGVRSPAQSPVSSGKSLGAVACLSARACLAVGTDPARSSPSGPQYILRWAGSRWTEIAGAPPPRFSCTPTLAHPCPQPTPAQQSAGFGDLSGVACHKGLGCLLVGGRGNGQPWSELWRGSKPVGILPASAPGTYRHPAALRAVACPTTTQCLALGTAEAGTVGESVLFERFTL